MKSSLVTWKIHGAFSRIDSISTFYPFVLIGGFIHFIPGVQKKNLHLL